MALFSRPSHASRIATLALALSLCALAVSCPSPAGGAGGDPGQQAAATIDRYFWGRWVRMDGSNESWYVSGTSVAIGSAAAVETSSTPTILAVPGASALRQTDNLVKVTPSAAGSLPYFLFRGSGANATIGATVLGSSAARGIGGLAGISMVLKNSLNPHDLHTIQSKPGGVVTVPDVILGDSYAVTIPVQPGVPEPIQTTVKPVFDGENVGSVNIVPDKQNFKVSYSIADNPEFLYAGQSYSLTIRIRNIGTASMDDANYEISQPDGLVLTGALKKILGSLEPNGGELSVSLTLSAPSLTAREKVFEIPVSVRSTVAPFTEWRDSVSLRLFRESMTINVRSARAEVQGVVISPDRSSYPFRTSGKKGSITLPARDEPYILALSGADYVTQTEYAVRVGSSPSGDGSALSKAEHGEPNDSEEQTTPLFSDREDLGWLGPRNLDFFSLYPFPESEAVIFDPPAGRYDQPVDVAIANGGAGIVRYTLDGSDPTEASPAYASTIRVDRDLSIRASCFGGSVSPAIVFSADYQYACLLSFDSAGGGEVAPQLLRHGALAAEPAAPDRQGYGFAGWFRDQACAAPWYFSSDTVSRDTTLHAKWLPLRTLTFDSRGGGAVAAESVMEGGLAPVPPAPAKADFAFAGWYRDEGCAQAWDFAVDRVLADATLYAKWTPMYWVIFNSQGGDAIPSAQCVSGNLVAEPASPSLGGFRFAGWFRETACANPWDFSTARVTEATTLYAKWLKTCTVTFNSKGGNTLPVQTVVKGTTALEPASPARTGYGFAGWYSDPDCILPWKFSTDLVESDLCLYAKWSTDYYTVSFNSMGGSAVAPVSVAYGGTLAPPAPTRTGYTLVGWYRERECVNQWTFATSTVTSSITLYASWSLNSYTVTFNPQGGNTVGSVTATHGSKIAAPTPPYRSGYSFAGWYQEAACATAWNFATDIVEGPRTLYAKWLPVFAISFNSQGGSAVSSVSAPQGSTITRPANPARTGYSFVGWYRETGCVTVWDFSSDVVTATATLYAKWSINSYRVTFDSQGGTSVGPIDAQYDTTISPPVPPTRNGYGFVGWYRESACATAWNFGTDAVVSDITLYAKMLPMFSVDFDSRGGGAVPSASVMQGSLVAKPSDPAKAGYVFGGWFRQASCAVEWSFSADSVSAGIVLYARWIPVISTVAGTGTAGFSGDGGPATAAAINGPYDVAFDPAGNLYFSDAYNNRIRKIDATGKITTLAGTGVETGGMTGDGGAATAAQVVAPWGIAADGSGNVLFADSNCVRRVDALGTITTIAGNATYDYAGDGGPATDARFRGPHGLVLGSTGELYLADCGNYRVRRISAAGRVETVAGNGTRGFSGDGGPATAANLREAYGVALDSSGNLYIADSISAYVRKVAPSGIITTIAGTGGSPGYAGDGGSALAAKLDTPADVAVDSAGNVYIADYGNRRIRKVSVDGTISTIAGGGSVVGDGGAATAASIAPYGLAIDAAGALYIADVGNHRIRRLPPP